MLEKFINFISRKDIKNPYDYISFIKESFDTYYNITKKEKINNVEFFYFDINNKKYRIYIEQNISENKYIGLQIGFERYLNKIWTIHGETKDLTAKESLTLFGTIAYVLKNRKFNIIFINTREMRKYNLYKTLINKLSSKIGGYTSEDNDWIYLISDEAIKFNIDKNKFNWSYFKKNN